MANQSTGVGAPPGYAAMKRVKRKNGREPYLFHAVNVTTGGALCGVRAEEWIGHVEAIEYVNCKQCIARIVKAAPMRTPTQRTWDRMKQRCNDPKHVAYARYGGRGIRVCERWNNSFAVFLEDMGERPEGKTLDRINPHGHYEPGNCRWATWHEQAANRSTDPYRDVREQQEMPV